APLPRRAMQFLHGIEKGQCLREGCCLDQTQRPEPLEIPHCAPELLARIGAEHRIELAAAVLQPAKIDRIGGKGCFAASEPPAAERCFGQAPLRPADMKLVGLAAKTGEPTDQL